MPRNRLVATAILAGLLWSGMSLGVSPSESGSRTICLDSADWRSGDVVFRRGTGIEAKVVESLDGSGYTHVGILAGASPNWTVIHVEPEDEGGRGRVEEIPLAEFLSAEKAKAMMVLRATGREPVASAVITYARKQLGKPFDGHYRYSTDDALYCTELVGKSYTAAGEPLLVQGAGATMIMLEEKLILPETLATSLSQRKRQAASRS